MEICTDFTGMMEDYHHDSVGQLMVPQRCHGTAGHDHVAGYVSRSAQLRAVDEFIEGVACRGVESHGPDQGHDSILLPFAGLHIGSHTTVLGFRPKRRRL